MITILKCLTFTFLLVKEASLCHKLCCVLSLVKCVDILVVFNYYIDGGGRKKWNYENDTGTKLCAIGSSLHGHTDPGHTMAFDRSGLHCRSHKPCVISCLHTDFGFGGVVV